MGEERKKEWERDRERDRERRWGRRRERFRGRRRRFDDKKGDGHESDGKAYDAEAGAEEFYDKKGDGHESLRGDIPEVATDEIRKDKLSQNLNMDYDRVKILQVYKT